MLFMLILFLLLMVYHRVILTLFAVSLRYALLSD